MNPPAPQLPPEAGQHVGDIIEFAGKAAVALGAVWAFIAGIVNPYSARRSKRRVEEIRTALKPELEAIARLVAREEQTNEKLNLVIDRQSKAFDEFDLFVEIMVDHQERHDETNTLLDEVGLAAGDRRTSESRRRRSLEALEELQGRARMRRRRADDIPAMEGPPS